MEKYEKKQRRNTIDIIGMALLLSVLLGSIIYSYIQKEEFVSKPTMQSQPMMYSEKPLAIKHFIYEGKTMAKKPATNKDDSKEDKDDSKEDLTTEEEKSTVKVKEEETTVKNESKDETSEKKSIINAKHYSCPLDEIYYTSPVREYTANQKELIAKMLYCEARGSNWDEQVAVCSAIINHIEHYGGKFSVLDNKTKFNPAPFYRNVTPNKMQYDVLEFVLSGHLIADVKYFRTKHYHNFGTQMFAVDKMYFSK